MEVKTTPTYPRFFQNKGFLSSTDEDLSVSSHSAYLDQAGTEAADHPALAADPACGAALVASACAGLLEGPEQKVVVISSKKTFFAAQSAARKVDTDLTQFELRWETHQVFLL